MSDPLYARKSCGWPPMPTGAGHLTAPDATAPRRTIRPAATGSQWMALEDGRITAMAHDTQACVLTQASAAILAGQGRRHDRGWAGGCWPKMSGPC